MKQGLLIFLLSLLSSICIIAQPAIIPLPQQYTKSNGSFIINSNTSLIIENDKLRDEAWYLQKELLRLKSIPIQVQNNKKSAAIVLSINQKPGSNNGSYILNISPTSIQIDAASEEGVFNGIISLLQLVAVADNKNNVSLDCWSITDAPLYNWRGLMLDESRHFFGKEKVKSILDWMAFYKLNKFHWHLTDEPGWRIQIKRYPLLTLVGGIGNYTDSLAPATYYTQEDVKEIVAYAAERKIDVIPEIDMPGHARAANRAYPQFSGGGSAKYPDFTFDPGNPATYQYLTNILKEVNTLFPSKMVHLGGDEVSFGNEKWNTNPGIKDLMQKNNLKTLKDVEDYFMKRMADSLFKLNSKILAWDEMANVSLPADKSIIFWWRHDKPEQLQMALNKNYSVVLCPRIPYYFDFVQDSAHQIGRKWKGDFAALEKVYYFDASKFVDAKKQSQVLGVQANVWTEQIASTFRLDYMIFPRISALAESAWSKNKNYNNYLERLKNHEPLYSQAGFYYYDVFKPTRNSEPEH